MIVTNYFNMQYYFYGIFLIFDLKINPAWDKYQNGSLLMFCMNSDVN